jgi:hypothetical protein
MKRSAFVSIVIAAWMAAGGCSAVFLPSPAAPASPTAPVGCNRSSPLPVIDFVAGGAAIIVAAQIDEKNHQSTAATAMVWGGLAAVVSGFWGNRKLNRCEELEAEQQKRREHLERLLVFAPRAVAAPPASAPAQVAPSPPAPAATDPWLGAGPPPEALGMSLLAPRPDGGAADAEEQR